MARRLSLVLVGLALPLLVAAALRPARPHTCPPPEPGYARKSYGLPWPEYAPPGCRVITPLPAQRPVIQTLAPAQASVVAGSSTTLSWAVVGATSVSIDHGVGTVAGVGTQAVSPAQKTTYTLTATNANGTAMASTTVEVTVAPPAAPAITSVSPESGAVGDTVTVTGTTFGAAPVVNFNGVTAGVVTPVSDTTLTAKVPAGATSGTISVTTAGGTATSASSFTVTVPAAAPTIASFAPSSGPVGTTVTVSGTGFTDAATVAFTDAVAGGDVVVVSSTQLSVTVPTGAVTGALSVTTAAGTATSASSFTVTAAAAHTVEPATATIIRGDTQAYTTSPETSVAWSVSPPVTCNGTGGACFNPASGTSTSWTGTITPGVYTIHGGSATATLTIPPVGLTVAAAATSVAASDTTTLTGTVDPATAHNTTVNWSVVEAGCGSVSPTNTASGAATTFTAPSLAGTCTVRARPAAVPDGSNYRDTAITVTGGGTGGGETVCDWVARPGGTGTACTLVAPCTFAEGRRKLSAGKTLCLRGNAGAYNESVSWQHDTTGYPNGAPGAPVVIAGYPGDPEPVFTSHSAQSGQGMWIFETSQSPSGIALNKTAGSSCYLGRCGNIGWITLRDLVFDGASAGGGANGAIMVRAGAHHITLERVEVKNAPCQGLHIYGDYFTCRDCLIHHNGKSSCGSPPHGAYLVANKASFIGGKYHTNYHAGFHQWCNDSEGAGSNYGCSYNLWDGVEAYGNGTSGGTWTSNGIQVCTGYGNVVRNSKIYDNKLSPGIAVDCGAWNTRIENNQIWGNGTNASDHAGGINVQVAQGILAGTTNCPAGARYDPQDPTTLGALYKSPPVDTVITGNKMRDNRVGNGCGGFNQINVQSGATVSCSGNVAGP